jgi:hypothetical protein
MIHDPYKRVGLLYLPESMVAPAEPQQQIMTKPSRADIRRMKKQLVKAQKRQPNSNKLRAVAAAKPEKEPWKK